MIKYIKTENFEITHEDQEVYGLRFTILATLNQIDKIIDYVRVTGEETEISAWKNRVNGIEITQQEMEEIWNSVNKVGKIKIFADKAEIIADGQDKAIITAHLGDDVEFVYIMVNGPPAIKEPVVDGIVEFDVIAEEPGFYKVEIATSSSSGFIIIEAVEV